MNISLITGSTLGNAEYVADHLSERLESQGFNTTIFNGPSLEELPLEGYWILITSTHGAGSLPDNLLNFYQQISEQNPDLSKLKFGAIGLGSREYDLFCNGISLISDLLMEKKANLLGDILKIDALSDDLPEDIAEDWLKNWQLNLK